MIYNIPEIKPLFMYNQQIVIQRVANGWIVNLPFEPPSETDQQLGLLERLPEIAQRLQPRDPELEGLRQDETEGAVKKPEGKISFKPIPNVFIYTDFDDVLFFLRESIADHNEPEQKK